MTNPTKLLVNFIDTVIQDYESLPKYEFINSLILYFSLHAKLLYINNISILKISKEKS